MAAASYLAGKDCLNPAGGREQQGHKSHRLGLSSRQSDQDRAARDCKFAHAERLAGELRRARFRSDAVRTSWRHSPRQKKAVACRTHTCLSRCERVLRLPRSGTAITERLVTQHAGAPGAFEQKRGPSPLWGIRDPNTIVAGVGPANVRTLDGGVRGTESLDRFGRSGVGNRRTVQRVRQKCLFLRRP